jgi:hypothetical protein
MSWSSTLLSGSGSAGLQPVLWTDKIIKWLPLFVQHGGHWCREDLDRRTIFWIFLSGLQMLEKRAKKCIWASWGVCWINPDFCHCSLFPSLSGWGHISTL